MTQPTRVALVLPLIVSLMTAPAVAQAPTASPEKPSTETATGTGAPTDLGGELARLNRTMDRIATLLEKQVQGRRLDLSLKRIELQTRRVETLEGELRSAEERQRSLEDQKQQTQSQLEVIARQLEAMGPEELEDNREGFRFMTEQAEAELGRIEGRLQESVQRVLELGNELTRRRDDLQAIQDRVDRELEGL